MRILGIDPGMAIVGYSVIESNGEVYQLVSSGSIQTSAKNEDAQRLLEITDDLTEIIKRYTPDVASVEKLFYFKNAKTIIPVAQARGVILMTLAKFKVPVFEYTPLVIKQALTGYGRATKNDVANMVMLSLNAKAIPKLDDTVDSIAIAICHARNKCVN